MTSAEDILLFHSYNSVDRDVVQSVAQAFSQLGFRQFFDRDGIQVGDRFWDAIEKAIDKSQFMLLYLGRSGIGEWQWKEYVYARDHARIEVIPVWLDDFEEDEIKNIARDDAEILGKSAMVLHDGVLSTSTLQDTCTKLLRIEINTEITRRRITSWGIVQDAQQVAESKRLEAATSAIGNNGLQFFRSIRRQFLSAHTQPGSLYANRNFSRSIG